MKIRALYVVSLLVFGLGLTACGSKGDLYLPEKTPVPQRATD